MISACSPIFYLINEEQFKKSLVPAIQKNMLRHPEILLECMPMILKNASVTLDVSAYAVNLGESLIGK